VLTSAQCLHGEGVAIHTRFDDLASLQAGYDFVAVLTEVAADTGTACRDGAFEGEHPGADGSPAGRLLCVLAPEGPTALWIDTERSVPGLVQLLGGSDYQILEDAWLAARLDAGPAAAATDSASADEQAGARWIELTHDLAVVPTAVIVWETSGNGFVTRLEAYGEAPGAWLTLWTPR